MTIFSNAERFTEITLTEPIRYNGQDNAEKWLNDLLCLDCGIGLGDSVSNGQDQHQPAASDCQLFLVDRDALFSGGARSERFLQRLMSIYVSSHYKVGISEL